MNRRHVTTALLAALAARSTPAMATATATATDPLALDPARHTVQTVRWGERTLRVRAFEGLPVVARPVEPAHQAINLYVPEAYFEGARVGAFEAGTAPVLLAIGVGGYMPALPGTLAARKASPGQPAGPASGQTDTPSASVQALFRGYVVAAPGARGRTQQAADGTWTGKAPAALLDLKAAVRWLRHNAARLPANLERIVSNGTSAGGALSALLGASGNHPQYDEALRALGAAAQRDDIHAVSAFCPITALDLADGAYEWQFRGVPDYRNVAVSMLDFRAQRTEVAGRLSEREQALSAALQQQFIAQVNARALPGPEAQPLGLQADGRGPLHAHLAELLRHAAQQALDAGADLSGAAAVRVRDGRVLAVDLDAHVRAIGRMKAFPAFDGLQLETGENQLFGSTGVDKRHFTAFSAQHSAVPGAQRAPEAVVRAMDPLALLADPRATVARHWRIRHGSHDRDTAFAIPALLAAAARQRGAAVDLALPWGRPHSGDYDMDAWFAHFDAVMGGG